MSRLSVLVSLRENVDFDEVARACEAAGLIIESRLNSIRILTGSVEEDSLLRLEEVEGVMQVEKQRNVYAL